MAASPRFTIATRENMALVSLWVPVMVPFATRLASDGGYGRVTLETCRKPKVLGVGFGAVASPGVAKIP